MTKLNRNYKDRLFLRVFSDKEYLLSLYNAINGSHYTNADELEITTLEDVIYMSMKNDVSFLLGEVLNLWEQQSSYNPNMPVRGLSYFAGLYQQYIERKKINVYSSKLKKLPFPQYIVFYNGRREEPDRMELRLSDAFEKTEATAFMEPSLEVKATMLNINYGNNRELMEQCRRLREYAQFIAAIRDFQDNGMSAEAAVNAAVDLCIKQGILEDILSSHRAEVIAMFLTDYDEQSHMAMERDEWTEAGRAEGKAEGRAEGKAEIVAMIRRKLKKQLDISEIANALEMDQDYVKRIADLISEAPDRTDIQVAEILVGQEVSADSR